MEIEKMNLIEVEERLASLETEVREMTEVADVEKATEEKRMLLERKADLVEAEQRKAQAEALQNEEVEADKVVEERKEKKMETVEMRSSVEYGQAFLRGIKTDDFAECRKLMTENGQAGVGDSNTVPVPTFLDTEIRNAWETKKIASLVKKTYQKGIVKCVFEVSATDAVLHIEGSDKPDEEQIALGSVTLAPVMIKKWITVTDEAIEGTTVDTIGYLYAELAQKIVEKAEEEIVKNITTAQVATDATHAGVSVINKNIAVDTILEAEALLSGKATNINIAMNRQSYPAFVALALKAGYAIDVFDGLKDKIVFTDELPAFSSASVGNVYAIVGDFGYGYQANFPNGNDITIKRDDLSLAEYDLVKLVGRQYVGHGIIAPKAFTLIKKVAEA